MSYGPGTEGIYWIGPNTGFLVSHFILRRGAGQSPAFMNYMGTHPQSKLGRTGEGP